MPRHEPLDAKTIAGDPAAVLHLIEQLRGARRAIRHLTDGNRQMEHAADVCARMNFADAEAAVIHMRKATFGDRAYPDGLPLCEVERAMAVKNRNPFVIYLAYAVVAPVIKRQLTAKQRDRWEAEREQSRGQCH